MKILWAAELTRYGSANLARVEVAKETDKSYVVANSKEILGFTWFGKATRKDSYKWFLTPELAIKWLSREYDDYIQRLEQDIAKARQRQNVLVETLITLEAAPAA